MTDNEIIKVLKYCASTEPCENCPYKKQCDETDLAEIAPDLINRQRSEIESLNEKERILIFQLYEEREKAIKEFAERLKEKLRRNAHVSPFAHNLNDVIIDNLVKTSL